MNIWYTVHVYMSYQLQKYGTLAIYICTGLWYNGDVCKITESQWDIPLGILLKIEVLKFQMLVIFGGRRVSCIVHVSGIILVLFITVSR